MDIFKIMPCEILVTVFTNGSSLLMIKFRKLYQLILKYQYMYPSLDTLFTIFYNSNIVQISVNTPATCVRFA